MLTAGEAQTPSTPHEQRGAHIENQENAMPHSDPALRMRIAEAIRQRGPMTVETIADLRVALDMTDVSKTQFSRALRSLHFQHPEVGVRVSRPGKGHPHSASDYVDAPPYRVCHIHGKSHVTTGELVDASSAA